MHLFFHDYQKNISVSPKKPLECSVWQALEIFNDLPEDDGSYLGFASDENQFLQFSKYNKYVWLVEIPVPERQGAFQGFFTKNKCLEIINNIFEGLPFNKVTGLTFEKYM